MKYRSRLSTEFQALLVLIFAIFLFSHPSYCGDSKKSSSLKSDQVSDSDEEITSLNRHDNTLTTSGRKRGQSPVRNALLERGSSGNGVGPSWRSNSRNNDANIDFDLEGYPSYEMGLEEQQRPKRGGYYFYGHPHSPNYFDRYFDRSRDRSGGGGTGYSRGREQNHPRQHDPSWGGKVMNKFRHRTNHLLNAASAVAFAHENYGNEDDDALDNEAAGSSYGGGGGGGGGYGKGVNKSAVGLLGFLSLLSLIQSGLTTAAPAPAGGGRRRRETDGSNATEITDLENADPVVKTRAEIEREAQSQKIAEIVLPLLTSFSFAMQEDQVAEQRFKCVLNEVCSSNHQLVAEFGEHGKDVGLMLGNVLESMAKKMKFIKGSNNDHLLKLKYAGRSGRNGKNCEKHYPKCE